MAKTNWQDPKTSEMRSTHISGLMEAVGKVEDSIGMETVTETNIPLTEVFISSDDRYRIFQAPEGKRNWTAEQAPVIKKNGAVISSGFEIDYGGGAIILNINDTVANTYTADVAYVKQTTISSLKTQRFVIGTSTAGWTAKDCDYLCDGTADQVEINNAITALPATGGEIVILDGTYNITAKIDVNKSNVSIRGNGNATILKRMWNSSSNEGVITLTSVEDCKIENLQVDGNKTTYTAIYNHGIYLYSSSNNTVTGNTCNNNYYGIYLYSSSNNNTITGNTCNNNSGSGIRLSSSSNNTITGNTCNNSSGSGIYLYSSSNNNTIIGNTCNNSSSGIRLSSSSNNTITGNICIRGTGQVTDYNSSEYTIRLYGTSNNYNLISSNNCMGKAVVVEGGTGNTVINNKWNETSDFEDLRADVGDKTTLTTTDKTNLVNAVNETKAQINNLGVQVVTQKLDVTSTDDATSAVNAPLKTAGGLAVAKNIFFGGAQLRHYKSGNIEPNSDFIITLGRGIYFLIISNTGDESDYNRLNAGLYFVTLRGSAGFVQLIGTQEQSVPNYPRPFTVSKDSSDQLIIKNTSDVTTIIQATILSTKII